MSSLCSNSTVEGRLPKAMGAATACTPPQHASELEISRGNVRNQARVQQCLPMLTCKAQGAAFCQHMGKGQAEGLC